MGTCYLANEDRLPQRLPVVYFDGIMYEIESIKDYNRFNKDGLSKLFSYIKWVEKHVSNRAIAFGYGDNVVMNSDGMTIILIGV